MSNIHVAQFVTNQRKNWLILKITRGIVLGIRSVYGTKYVTLHALLVYRISKHTFGVEDSYESPERVRDREVGFVRKVVFKTFFAFSKVCQLPFRDHSFVVFGT